MGSLNIAIDASRSTVYRVTGTEYYSRRLLQALVEMNARRTTPHHLTLYFRDKPAEDLFKHNEYTHEKVIPFARAWTHLRFAAALWKDRPDVTFVPAHTLPFIFPGRAVVTVHDLGYKHFPQTHTRSQRLYLDLTTRHSARRAASILADSQMTANDLAEYYHIPMDKIRVVYPGVDKAKRGNITFIKKKYNLPEHYFLFIGTLQPRKNIPRIVEAFKAWQKANPDSSIGLVLAGGKGWLYDESWVEGVENICLPGYIDKDDKGALYAGAIALVFPSLYEGFGFPVIEAMQVGTPVIASNTSSLPELAGEAGMLVDPLDVESITVAMDLISSQPRLREKLRLEGLLRATQFTWNAAADKVLNALEETAQT